jgi:hypothetical protein
MGDGHEVLRSSGNLLPCTDIVLRKEGYGVPKRIMKTLANCGFVTRSGGRAGPTGELATREGALPFRGKTLQLVAGDKMNTTMG